MILGVSEQASKQVSASEASSVEQGNGQASGLVPTSGCLIILDHGELGTAIIGNQGAR